MENTQNTDRPKNTQNTDRPKITAGTATKIGLGVGIAGALGFGAYEIVKAFVSPQGAGCSQLQSELASVIKQQFDIYNNSVTYHAGTMTATQQGQIVTLQKEQASLIAQIGKQCTPPAGQTLQEYLNKVIAFAGWTAIALIAFGGVVLTARMYSWLRGKWGGGNTDPSSPPTSVEDASPPSDFTPTSVNMDFASLFDFMDLYAADMAAVEVTDAEIVSDAVDIIALE